MLRLPVLPNVNGAALELEASKTAKIDSRALERATWRAQPRLKLFCCFFIDVFLLIFGCQGNVCHSPSVPGNSERSSRKISKGLNFSIRLRHQPLHKATAGREATARQAGDSAPSQKP